MVKRRSISGWSVTAASFMLACAPLLHGAEPIRMTADGITFSMDPTAGRYGFAQAGRSIVGADSTAGVLLAGSPVSFLPPGPCRASRCVLQGTSATGGKLRLTVTMTPHQAELLVEAEHPGDEVRFVTAGATPAFGLADHAVKQASFRANNKQFDTDVTGFSDDNFSSGQEGTRLVSNFVIYPKQGFAELLVDPTAKIVHTSAEQIVQGVVHAPAQVRLHYFFGTPHDIYAAFLKARVDAGYPVFQPKYVAFGVGWEAFGALAWDTTQKSVGDSVDRYLKEGYPLTWVVIGSGFWPAPPEFHETTSFGLWDPEKYPDPKGLLAHFHDEKLQVMLGLRTTFITTGPFAAQGTAKGFFLTENYRSGTGPAKVFTGCWPKMPYYLLDAHNPAALDWYMSLTDKWKAFGVDGYKEDYFCHKDLRDDMVDPTNNRLMQQGALIIERNGYLSSNGDVHRIDDFNYNQNQDRGPVNALAFAYSGFPFVYPDIVGGTFGENHFTTTRTPRLQTYMQRNAQWAAMHASMGMGEPPWTFSAATAKIMLDAARFHARIVPYLFAMSRRATADGYPWTMTPLPIAFPDDPHSYGRENATDRTYEWMIGDSMLATPLYGNDYDTANTRDIYLPNGQWMDFDTGNLYAGKQTLKAFALPPGKTPLFIGGSGVTLEQIGGTVKACVYPVAQTASATLTVPTSDAAFTVAVSGLPTGTTWSGMTVTDRSGHTIPVAASGHGWVFTPVPGESYKVKALR